MSQFRKDFISGVAYTSIAKYTGIFISLIITFILARLLCPEDFGVLALVTVIIGFINQVTNLGLHSAIIQTDILSQRDLRSLFSLTMAVGAIASLILFFCASQIAVYYSNDKLINVVRILSCTMFFTAVNTVPSALLMREKKFKKIAIRQLFIQVLSGVIGIMLAFLGFGLYALVAQAIVTAAGTFLFNYIQYPIKLFSSIKVESIRKIFSYSAYQFLAGLFIYFTRNIDKPLVGRYLSLNALGYYDKSFHLMTLPVSNLAYVIGPVMQPLFKDFRHDSSRMFQKYGTLLKFMSIISLPLSAYLFLSAYDLILLLYGNQWGEAVEPFQYLSLSIGLQILLSISGPIFLANGNSKLSFINCLVEFSITMLSLVFGLSFRSLNGVALSVSFGVLFRFVYIYYMLCHTIFEVSIMDLLRILIPSVFACICCMVVLLLANWLLADANQILRLLIFTLLSGLVIMAFLNRENLLTLKIFAQK